MVTADVARLLDLGGGVAFVGLGAPGHLALTWLVIWLPCLGFLHVLLASIRGRLPLVLFCLFGAVASVAIGLVLLWDLLEAHAERSLASALTWGPGFALGLFVVGALMSAAWAALTLGLTRLLQRGREKAAT